MQTESKNVGMDIENETFILKSDSSELCRLCANTDNQLIPIFKGEGIEHNIPNKIEQHLPIIKVTELDKLPLQICYQCASTLIAWHNLYEGSKIADKRLREVLCIDEKLCQNEETYENYDDDFHDDYDDQSSNNFLENIQLNSASTSSQPEDLQQNVTSEVNELNDEKTSDETENNNPSDERSAYTMNDEQGRNNGSASFMKAVPDENIQNCVNARIIDNVPENTPCINCAKINGVKCSTCVETDSLRCNFCPMFFLNKIDIKRHLMVSHSEVFFSKSGIYNKPDLNKLKPGEHSDIHSIKIRIQKSSATEPANPDVQNEQDKRSPTYQCDICLKVCLTFRGLTRHTVVHKNDISAVSCNYCKQMFANDEKKQKHVSEYHRIDVPAHETDESPIKLENFDEPEDEPLVETEDADISTGWFGNQSNDPADIKKKFVEKETKAKGKLLKSNSIALKNKKFTCPECEETFARRPDFVTHQLTHSTAIAVPKTTTCNTCGKQCSTEEVLKKHKKVSHRKKRMKVPDEDDPFRRWYVFADGQKHLKCDQCKYNSLWYHKGRFLEHYRIHTGEKPFTCALCGKQFRTKTLLQKHVMFVHEGIKEHPCDICGRRFSDKRYMEDHRRIHTGERPYVCDLCGKTFKQSASLFIHKELHKGLRKHACEMCGKRFTTRSSLTIHIKRHVGERNFICATCGKAFVDGKHLKDHMAVHSDERPFKCELCGGRFKLMKHLKQHGRTHKRD